MAEYTDAQIRQYIREVVSATKATAHVDTGFLKRSIKGALIGRDKSVEFREVFYGAYKNNAQLVENAKKIMPRDIPWKVIFVDEQGQETPVEGVTKMGRKISRKSIDSKNVSTNKIKSLIKAIQNAKKKDSGAEGNRGDNEKAT